jgi:hypothetical protein
METPLAIEDICWNCGHGTEHHKHGDACRFEVCTCLGPALNGKVIVEVKA